MQHDGQGCTVALLSRNFTLKNQGEKEKFDKYSGGNIQTEYIENDNKMVVTHTFNQATEKTCVIEFQFKDEPAKKKQLEWNKLFNQNKELITPEKLIDGIRKTIWDIKSRSESKPETASNKVPIELPLHIDLDTIERTLTEPRTTLNTPNYYQKKE